MGIEVSLKPNFTFLPNFLLRVLVQSLSFRQAALTQNDLGYLFGSSPEPCSFVISPCSSALCAHDINHISSSTMKIKIRSTICFLNTAPGSFSQPSGHCSGAPSGRQAPCGAFGFLISVEGGCAPLAGA